MAYQPTMRTVKVKDLKPADYNPRTISEKAIQGLEASMERFGLVEPIIFNQRTGHVVGGHQRLKVLLKQDVEETSVVVVDLPESEEKALNIALNNPHIMGEFTEDLQPLLEAIEDELPELYQELQLDGLRQRLPGEIDVEDDEIPETPKVAKTKRGDIYQLGNHRLMCGDSTDEEDMKSLLRDQIMTLVVTSPPYYNQRKYSFFKTFEEYETFIESVIKNSTINSGEEYALCWNIGDQCAAKETKDIPAYHSLIMEKYLKYRDKIIWKKAGAVFDIPRSQHIENGRYFPALGHETILVYTKKHPKFDIENKANIREWQINVWEIRQVKTNKESDNEGHPAQFPLELPMRCVPSYSQKGQNVLDPFGGSGTTMIAAERTGRICFMMELDPIYCDVIVQRWENETGKKAILEGHHGE